MNRKKGIVLAMAAAALSVAALSANYLYRPTIVDQGGGVTSSSSYQMRGSVGGPVVAGGVTSSTNFRFEVNSVDILLSESKEELTPAGNGGGGGGCSAAGRPASAAFLLPALLILLGSRAIRRKRAAGEQQYAGQENPWPRT